MHVPDRLGKYLIRRELGRGAMGVVFEGYDPLIERPVAIKVLRIDEANAQLDAELRLRFRREAQAAGRLSHPNIVSVYEYGEEAGSNSAFIAMELVEGRDLKSLFDDGQRFALADTGRIMGELLGALQHAHERGVVHRDIKPANIILLADGSVKVADFGIAKLDTSELTQLGSVLGTVSHMSPEQLTGEAVDRRSDLFSCGVILYQLLTGERAFTGSPATVMHRVLHEDPAAPSSVVAALPRSLDAVIGKAMAKKPADRYATADAFAAALRGALADAAAPAARTAVDADADADATVPSATRPAAAADPDATVVLARQTLASARASRSPALLGAGVLLLVAAGAAGYLLLKPATPPGRIVAEIPKSAIPASATTPSDATAVSMAPASMPTPASATVAAPPAPVATSSGPSADEIEQEAWDDALKTNSVAAFEAYLKGYPKGRYAARARVRLAALAPKAPPPDVPATARAPTVPARLETSPPAPPPALVTIPGPQTPKPEPKPSAPPTSPAVAGAAPKSTTASPSAPVAASTPQPTKTAALPPQGPAKPAATAPAPTTTTTTATAPATAKPAGSGPSECADDAQRRSARCQVALGHMHRNGNGVPRDPVEAARWYRKAADQGNDVGQYELGKAYESGQGVAKDPVQAVGWFRKAAEQGLARAQNRVGVAYENGIAGPANLVLASDWYKKAAEQNNPDAQTNLARLYLRGRGVFKDVAKAAELAQKAADQGDPNAMVLLAGMYQSGDGKPRDPSRASKLYRDALASPNLSQHNRERAQAALSAKS